MTSFFFSIVVATRNVAETLPRCLESLAVQQWREFEVVLQDADSVDATLEIARDFQSRLPGLLVFSEPDTGIYDAWNKALGRVTGEWILFLGADDVLDHSDALGQAANVLQGLPRTAEYFATPVLLTTNSGHTVGIRQPSKTPKRDILSRMPFPHQGLFHRRRLFAGRCFDKVLQIVGDYDFLCRTLTSHNVAYGGTPLVRMALGGISNDIDGMLARDIEFLQVARRHFSGSVSCRLYLRLLRGIAYKIVAAVCGRQAGLRFDDAISRAQGKPALLSQMRNI